MFKAFKTVRVFESLKRSEAFNAFKSVHLLLEFIKIHSSKKLNHAQSIALEPEKLYSCRVFVELSRAYLEPAHESGWPGQGSALLEPASDINPRSDYVDLTKRYMLIK